MTEDDLRSRGREMRRVLLGEEATRLDETVYRDDPHMGKLADLANEVIFGILWSRPGIDLKTRCLVTLVADVATGQDDALGLHVRFARRHGWTEDEIVEAILHLTGYVGVPLVRRAVIVAKAVFEAMRAEGEAGSKAPDSSH